MASHPDVATLSVAAAAVAIPASAFAWLREAQHSKRLEVRLGEEAQRAKQHADREMELQRVKRTVEAELREAINREKRLQSSIAERGRLGERALEQLLAEAKESGHARGYQLQPSLSGGIRPDAVIELAGERVLVVDSKAPEPPTQLLESADEAARLAYVETLKRHIQQLGSKQYHAGLPGALPRTWMLLPGEGYLDAAYSPDGSGGASLHQFADARGVALVGPHGLRSVLHMWQTLRSEVEQEQRLSDDGVQLRLQALQPIWVDQMLPRSKAMGKDLRKVVTRFNEMAEMMIAFDAALRHEEVLGLPRARKTSLPPTVAPPDGDELDAEMTVTPNGHAEGGADLVDGGADGVCLSESSVSLAVAVAPAEARGQM